MISLKYVAGCGCYWHQLYMEIIFLESFSDGHFIDELIWPAFQEYIEKIVLVTSSNIPFFSSMHGFLLVSSSFLLKPVCRKTLCCCVHYAKCEQLPHTVYNWSSWTEHRSWTPWHNLVVMPGCSWHGYSDGLAQDLNLWENTVQCHHN